jgi:tetratricopeptide (TPR) repeat protein
VKPAPLLLALLAAAPALAQPRPAAPASADLRRANARLEFGAWAEAAAIVRQYLGANPKPAEAEAVLAYRILGLAEWHLGDRPQARSAFVALLSEDPDYKLDPFLVPPPIVEFFEEVRREQEPLLEPLRERKRALREQERLAEEARRRLLAEERARSGPPAKVLRVQDHIYGLNWVPFGAGQFQNGHRAKGTAIAAGELVLGAANVGAILLHNRLATDPGRRCSASQTVGCSHPPFSDSVRSDLRTVDVVKYASAGLFWALYAYGVVDAHLHYLPRVETEITPRLDQVSVSLAWSF